MNPVYVIWGVMGLLWIGLTIWLCTTPLMDGFDLGGKQIVERVRRVLRDVGRDDSGRSDR